jgi:superoxide dismutase
MKFVLPEFPFAKDALNPIISEEAIDYHHGKHHNAYVTNLNKMIEGTDFQDMEPHFLLEAINRDFGSFNEFKAKFSTAAATLFGSGMACLERRRQTGNSSAEQLRHSADSGQRTTSYSGCLGTRLLYRLS